MCLFDRCTNVKPVGTYRLEESKENLHSYNADACFNVLDGVPGLQVMTKYFTSSFINQKV